MKKKILCGLFGLSLVISTGVFANSGFPCPNPISNELIFTTNMSILYAPQLTTNMPASLMGPGMGEGNVAWDGPIWGIMLNSAETSTITFESLILNNNVPECHYLVSGKDYHNPDQDVGPVAVVVTPGNASAANLYKYSLSNGQTHSADINTTIIPN